MEPGRSLVACAAAAALACAGAAEATPQAQGSSRGVRVLLPDAQPTPSTEVAPTPQPSPTPVIGPVVAPVMPRSCDRAFATTDLTLSDAAAFDRSLGDLLARKPARVVIDVPDRFDPGAPPSRLQPWLAQVADGGGTVTATEISCGRGFGFSKLLAKLFGRRQPVYEVVRGYDAVLWYDKVSTRVTQVQLTRRS